MRDFNFFSSYIETKNTSKKKQMYIGSIAIAVILLIGGFSSFNVYKANSLEKEIQGLKDYLNSEEVLTKSKEVKEKKRKMEVMKKYYAIVEEINMNMDQVDIIGSELMEKISSTTPKDLFVKTMSLTAKDIQMAGIAKNRVPVAEFEHNLKELKLFEKVHVSMINKESEESSNYIFAIRCTLKDVKNNETD